MATANVSFQLSYQGSITAPESGLVEVAYRGRPISFGESHRDIADC